MHNQGDLVIYDVSRRWAWEYRQRKCEAKYFDPREVNGFQNYSLADADQYNYRQLTAQQVTDRGLWVINKDYRATIDAVFAASDAIRGWKGENQ